MMDIILYDNDFITRWTPFDESRHYGDWLDKIVEVVAKSIETLEEDFYTEEVIETLEGTRCGFKSTSCPDQLSKALRKAIGA